MRHYLRILLVSLAAGSASLFADPAVGAPAPDFAAKDAAGRAVKLSDHKGKIVVLEWFNPGCPFVKKFYAPGKMQELQKTYAAKGVVWITVASTKAKHPDHLDGAALTKKAAEWKASPAVILDDTDGAVARLYAAKTTPHLFVVGADGKLLYKGAIDSGRSPKSDDIAGATPYLANALDAALAGKTPEPADTKPYGCGVKL